MKSSDVIVLGAGPAGAIAAYVLAREGRSVCLLDIPRSPLAPRIGESLPAAAGPLLEDLGLAHVLGDRHHLPSFGHLSAWGEGGLRATDFMKDPHGYGWHLDRARFDGALKKAAVAAGARAVDEPGSAIEWTNDAWSVPTRSHKLVTPWIIDATGRRGHFVRQLGIPRSLTSDLVSVYAWLKTANDDYDTRAIVETSAEGWWYSAKLSGDRRVLALQTDRSTAQAIFRSTDALARAQVFSAMARRTEFVAPFAASGFASPLFTHDAGSARLEIFSGAGWLAVGDAAISFDPLSSQGLFNALSTGRAAGLALDAQIGGDWLELRRYSETLESVWRIYEARRRHYYALETRWPMSDFWANERLRVARAF